jgi:hypothetical protein
MDADDFAAVGLALALLLYAVFVEVYGRVASRRFASLRH